MRGIGLDVHKHFAEVAIAESGRKVRSGGRIAATPKELKAFAATLGPDDQVVLEATFNTWAIAELLQGRVGRLVVSNPMRTKAIASAKVKTDKIDAAILAELLAAQFIPEVWIPDERTRGWRRAVSHRRALVQQYTRLKGRIRSVLHAIWWTARTRICSAKAVSAGFAVWTCPRMIGARSTAPYDCWRRLTTSLPRLIAT